MPADPLLFDKVQIFQPNERPRRWLMRTPVAGLLLWDGDFLQQAGLLHLTPESWVLLTPGQIFDEEFIPWPQNGGPIKGFRLRKTTVHVELR